MPAAFDRTKPSIADTRALALGETNENLVALWLNTIGGGDGSQTWSYAVTAGTNAKPTEVILTSGTLRVRFAITWGSTGSNYPTAIAVDYSTNSGSSYDADHATLTYSYASGEITGGNVGSLLLAWLMRTIGALKELEADVAALSGGSLGTMSTQNASAVAITGGTADNLVLGSTTPTGAYFTRAMEVHVAVAFGGASTNLAVNTGASFSFTATGSGAAALTLSGMPQTNRLFTFVVWITNGGLRTWTWPTGTRWAGGAAPTLSAAGLDAITFTTFNAGTNWQASLLGKAFA